MANQPSPTVEELQLRKRARRRLIGAITLVVLMVTVLPMILDDEPKPVGQDIAISIPSPQGADAPLKVTPAPVPPTAAPAESLPPMQPVVPSEPKKRVATVEKAVEPKPKPAPAAQENVAVPLLLLGKRRTEAHSRAKDFLEKVGMGGRLNSLPAQLSGGQQQRVAIARALVHSPRLLVCDEPTSALEHETGRLVMEVLRNTALSEDRALIIVTHDNRIFNFADRVARMDDGRIVSVESQVATQ